MHMPLRPDEARAPRHVFRCSITAAGAVVIEDPLLLSVRGGGVIRHKGQTYYVNPALPEVKQGCVEEMSALLDAPGRTSVRGVRVVLRGA